MLLNCMSIVRGVQQINEQIYIKHQESHCNTRILGCAAMLRANFDDGKHCSVNIRQWLRVNKQAVINKYSE